MGPQRNLVSIEIMQPRIDPIRLCNLLGWLPESRKDTAQRSGVTTRHSGGHQLFRCCVSVGDTDRVYPVAKIQRAVDEMSRVASEIDAFIASGGSIKVIVGWFCEEHTGDLFTGALLRQLGRFSVALEFYIYPTNDSE